jgi:hypothetical protein
MWDTLAYELKSQEMGVPFLAGAEIFNFTKPRIF